MNKKFIILSNQRCGSTFLSGLINQHTKLTCYFEEPKENLKILKHNQGLYLKYKFHIQKSQLKEFKNRDDISIIHLIRENSLNHAISQWFNTNKTKSNIPYAHFVSDEFKWRNSAAKQYHKKRETKNLNFDLHYQHNYTLPINEIKSIIDRHYTWSNSFLNEMRSYTNVLNVTYESLTNDSNIEHTNIDKIFEFLGVTPETVKADLRKIHTKDFYENNINNYQDLLKLNKLITILDYE